MTAIAGSRPAEPIGPISRYQPAAQNKGSQDQTGTDNRTTENPSVFMYVFSWPDARSHTIPNGDANNSRGQEGFSVLNFLLVAATFGLFGVGLWQGAISRETASKQLRAYVFGRCRFIHSFDATKFAEVMFEIENVGLTPANALRHNSDVVVGPHPLPFGFKFPQFCTPLSNPITVFPRFSFEARRMASSIFNAQDIANLISGTHRIYIYGRIVYDDIFGRTRETNFAVSVAADVGTLTKLTSNYLPSDLKVTFETARSGNAAT